MKKLIAILIILIQIFACNRVKNKVESIKGNLDSYLRPTIEEKFKKCTDLNINDTIYNIKETDTYFPLEGEYSLVFNTTEKQINEWIKNKPPWNNKKWQKGPRPYNVLNCNFGLGGTGRYIKTDTKGNVDTVYTNKNKLFGFLTKDNFIYVSREFCCPNDSNLRYHNGQLLILEVDSNKIWYSNWDY
jgi:hypothetical protein